MLAVLTAVFLAVAAPGQTATDVIDEAAASLRSDNVYVDPGAERALSDAEADDLRDHIADAGVAVFVAVLPASAAGGDPDALPGRLAAATGLAGDYAVIAGDSFRATSGTAASAAFQAASDEGTLAVLRAYVDEVGGGGAVGSGGSEPAPTTSDGDDEGASWLPIALLGAGGVGLFAAMRRRRQREQAEDQRAMQADIQMLRAELSVLSEDVLRLEPQIALHPDAREDYEAASDRFRAASAALDYADEPVDLVRVERVVSEARYAMARARAIVAGHEPPPPPAELRRPGRHDEPPLDVDEYGRPVYVGAGQFYGGGGWFGGGGGGLFSGLLLGSMLGGFGGWGWGGGFGGHGGWGDGGGGGGFDGGGGGDFGGGDWGGDIGGGDF